MPKLCPVACGPTWLYSLTSAGAPFALSTAASMVYATLCLFMLSRPDTLGSAGTSVVKALPFLLEIVVLDPLLGMKI